MIHFALQIPIDRKLRVSRESDSTSEVDIDALSRLVAIANLEGLNGNQICGVFARPSSDGAYIQFSFEYSDQMGTVQ